MRCVAAIIEAAFFVRGLRLTHFLYSVTEGKRMKKAYGILFAMILLFQMTTTVSAISLSEKEDIYRVDEFTGNSLDKEFVIQWLMEDDNFIYHLHETSNSEKYVNRFLEGLLTGIDITGEVISGNVSAAFEVKDDYYNAIKDILLSYSANEKILDVEDAKSKIRVEYYAGFIDNLIKYGLNVPKFASLATELKSVKVTNQLKTMEELYKELEIAVPDDGQQQLWFLLDEYVESAKFSEYLSNTSEVVSYASKGLKIAQFSYDLLIELEAYNTINSQLTDVLQYLYQNSSSADVKKVAGELWVKSMSSKQKNLQDAVNQVYAKIGEVGGEAAVEIGIGIVANKLKLSNVLAGAGLGITFGNLYSDLAFSTSDIREQLTFIEVTNEISTVLVDAMRSKLNAYELRYSSSYGSYEERAKDAKDIILYSKLLLQTRRMGEKAYYTLKETAWDSAAINNGDEIFSLLGLSLKQPFEKIKDWYESCCADFETAERILYSKIDVSMYQNLYEYPEDNEDFEIVDGKLIAYYGSDAHPCVPDEVHTIGTEAFNTEVLMTQLTIRGIKIESKAISNCKNLEELFIPETVTIIQNDAVYNCPNITIYGYAGTAAENYAKDNHIPFYSLGMPGNLVWDGSIATGFAGGDGSEENPYQISDGTQLAYLSEQVKKGNTFANQNFELTNDIKLNNTSDVENWESNPPINTWNPIGDYFNRFMGTFDGRNFTVSGIYIDSPETDYQGLFGVSSGEIHNLDINNAYIRGNNYVGGIAGYSSRTIGCNAFKTFVIGEQDYIGGIVGYGNVRECSNFGNVRGRAYIGGVIGCFTYPNLQYCYNSGNVESIGYSTVMGGVAGYHYPSSYSMDNSIESCYNLGTIRGNTTGEYNTSVGGIVGYAYYTPQNSVVGFNEFSAIISNCYNIGDIYTTSGHGGGVIGDAHANYNKEIIIQNCYNTGMITGGNTTYLGGILGEGQDTYIQECYNEGRVVSEGDGNVAGIGPFCRKIVNCYNSGDITGNGNLSGIGNASILDSYNSGKVHSNTGSASGIGGRAFRCYNLGDISGIDSVAGISGYAVDCYNKGKISGYDNVGGISPSGYVENCYNLGEVCGRDNVGGIAGRMSEFDSVINSYNLALITASGKNVGGIVGFCNVMSPVNEWGNASISNCYNQGVVQGKENVGGIAGYSYIREGEFQITNCYNIGKILGSENISGILGQVEIYDTRSYNNQPYFTPLSTVKNSYNIGEVIGETNVSDITGNYKKEHDERINLHDTQSTYFPLGNCMKESGGIAVPLSEMRKEETYINFDFNKTWNIQPDINYGYPYLTSMSYQNTSTNYIKGEVRLEISDGYLVLDVANISAGDSNLNFVWYNNGQPQKNIFGDKVSLAENPMDGDIYVEISSKDYFGSLKSNTIKLERPLISGEITIMGTPVVNNVLYIEASAVQPNDCTFIYQWYCDGKIIENATGSTYTISSGDIGKTISAKIVAYGMFSGELEAEGVKIKDVIYGVMNSNIKWELDKNECVLTIMGSGATDHCEDFDTYSQYIKTVKILEGITEIGHNTFYTLHNIEKCYMSDTICSIASTGFNPWDFEKMIFYGYSSSYAEEYATKNNIKFVNLGKIPVKIQANAFENEDEQIMVIINSNIDLSGKKIIVGLYEKSGKLIKTNIESVQEKLTQYQVVFEKDGKFENEDYYIKIFVWDSLETLQPVCKALRLNVE